MSQSNCEITILLAEDEEPLRSLFTTILRNRSRYQLFVAKDGREALQISKQHEGKIDLLVSNVQMPEITGPDLARELKQSRPDTRVMLMSGYAQGLLILDHGWHFLQKPFSPQAIVDKIEEILSGPVEEQTNSAPAAT